ncbi:response regulator transcription factor [Clostridium neuense]|uniref:Stage 0 sporulation protein A homolog n=1 Tax=Clostridium neuense TaxID=1728934 RepID=A0ABW8T9T3_9CLOT
MYKIFLVEDDEKLNEHIKEYLQMYDYEVYVVEDFKNTEKEFEFINPDLVLLDINLPYSDGFYLCRVFRKKSNVPIIITSARTAEIEQIMGIELGADDYITKPFSLKMLLTKISAALRRTNELSNDKKSLKINGLELKESNFRINYKDREIELSKNEFALLKKLVENKDVILKRETLLELIWDDSEFVNDNTLTVNITRVKNKLKELGIEDVIKTKRGVGYVFAFGK